MYTLYNSEFKPVIFASIQEVRNASKVGSLYAKYKDVKDNRYLEIADEGNFPEQLQILEDKHQVKIDYFRVYIGTYPKGEGSFYVTTKLSDLEIYSCGNEPLPFVKVLGPDYHIDHLTDKQVEHMITTYF